MQAGTEFLTYSTPHSYALCFPTLFPLGVEDFGDERATQISLADYVRHVLCIRTPQFRQHALFQLLSFDRILRTQLFASVRMNISGVSDAEALMLSRVTPAQLG